jgi:hypothetical protein
MTGCCGDLSLSDALSDPIVQAVMQADNVDPSELEAELLAVARVLESPPTAVE